MSKRKSPKLNLKFGGLVVLALLLFFLGAGANQKDGLKLTKVYTHSYDPGQRVRAALDSTGQYLALVGTYSGVVQIIDRQRGEEISRGSLETISCPEQDLKTYTDWHFIPETSWALVVACEELYLLRVETLEIVQKLTSRSEGRPRITDTSADGRYFTIILNPLGDQQREWVILVGRNGQEWQRLAKWTPFSRLTPGNRIRAAWVVPGRSEIAVAYSRYFSECGLIIYDFSTLKPAERYALPNQPYPDSPESTFCTPLSGSFVGHTSDIVIQEITGAFPIYQRLSDNYGVYLMHRKFPTGEIIETIRLKASGPIRHLRLAPDGELAASETCDDPEDMGKIGQLTCRLFTIWDTTTGMILYESPSGLAGWTRWAKPTFSPDGKYLLVVKYGKVEIYEISRH